MRRENQLWCRFWTHPPSMVFNSLSFRISTFWGRWLRMTTSFLRWDKKVKVRSKLAKLKTRSPHLEQNSPGGWWSCGWKALAERWTTIRFSTEISLQGINLKLPVARGCQRNGQLHSSNLLQACLPGSLQVRIETRRWEKTIYRWKSYTAPEKTVLMTNVQVRHSEFCGDFVAGQCLPALPEGWEQTWMDAGSSVFCCS